MGLQQHEQFGRQLCEQLCEQLREQRPQLLRLPVGGVWGWLLKIGFADLVKVSLTCGDKVLPWYFRNHGKEHFSNEHYVRLFLFVPIYQGGAVRPHLPRNGI